MEEIENLKNLLTRIPNIGNKAAYNLIYKMLEDGDSYKNKFIDSIQSLKKIRKCQKCFNYCTSEICDFCSDKARIDKRIICIIEKHQDIQTFEDSGFFGLYFILGNLLSPIEGIGPEKLNINYLIQRIEEEDIKELIFALKPNTEGNATCLYIKKTLLDEDIKIKLSRLAFGIQIGKSLSHIDKFTLNEALNGRTVFE